MKNLTLTILCLICLTIINNLGDPIPGLDVCCGQIFEIKIGKMSNCSYTCSATLVLATTILV
jgi:hypothetical protein